MPAPLTGIKVLDFSRAQQGPYCTVMLSDMGAEILKVEPIEGESGRGIGEEGQMGIRPYFVAHDRGKKSITLDLKKEKAREIAYRLVKVCDVVVHNNRPGVMERLKLDYETVRQINPRIIYAEASGFGSKGAQKTRPAYDIVGQAMGGIMSITGEPGGYPLPAGAAIGDQTGAIILAFGVMSALVARERFGVGQKVESSLYGTIITLQSWEIDHHSITGQVIPKGGRGHPLIPGLWGSFKTADGYMVIGGVGDARWGRFCKIMGLEHLEHDPRFEDGIKRRDNANVLRPFADEAFLKKATDEWLRLFKENDMICAPVQDFDDVLNDPQAIENQYIINMDHPHLGSMKIVGCPIHLTETPEVIQGPPPELGQNTEEILLEAGYDWDEINALRDEGVV